MTALGYAMFFGVLGPLLGAAVLMGVVMPLVFGMGEHAEVSDYSRAFLAALLMSIGVAPIALLVGGVPAGITGLMYWWLKSRTTVARLPALVRAAVMSLVGGAACVLFGLCLGAAVPEMLSRESLELLVAPGMAAAALCTLLADWRTRHLPPNNASRK